MPKYRPVEPILHRPAWREGNLGVGKRVASLAKGDWDRLFVPLLEGAREERNRMECRRYGVERFLQPSRRCQRAVQEGSDLRGPTLLVPQDGNREGEHHAPEKEGDQEGEHHALEKEGDQEDERRELQS